MKVYLTLHTEGNRTYHKQFYKMFNDEYKTNESGFVGDDNKYSETEGIKVYDLSKNKYVKLRELFIKVGFNRKDYYYSIGRPFTYINGGETRHTKIYGDIEEMKLQTYNNGSLNITKNKYHNYHEYAKSYIMFHKEPVYTNDETDDFKPESEKVYMKENINHEHDLKLMEINKKLIQQQTEEIKQRRKEQSIFNKKNNINIQIRRCSSCGYTDDKGVYNNYSYIYDESDPHKCINDIRH